MSKTPSEPQVFAGRIGKKAERMQRAQRRRGDGVWFGLGAMGAIGWSVAMPTLVGALAGRWLDGRHVGAHSWTAALLVAGLTIGCFNAWFWVAKEDREIHADSGDTHE